MAKDDKKSTESVTPRKSTESPTRIRYVGSADVKVLTHNDLQQAGVTNPERDYVWDSQNDFVVAASDVNASTLEYLRSQPDFRIE